VEWQAVYAGVNTFMSRLRDADGVKLEPIMTLVVRPKSYRRNLELDKKCSRVGNDPVQYSSSN
jgi:hypothetical protein